MNSTIMTASGKWFDVLNPNPGAICISDISNALSKICRFGGHINRFYSVAEHLVNCYKAGITLFNYPAPVLLALLMHDATEAYIGDMVKPLKEQVEAYKEIERNIELAIGQKFCIDFDKYKKEIKQIDFAILIAEKNVLFKNPLVWTNEENALFIPNLYICGFDPMTANEMFMRTFSKAIIDSTFED